MKESLDLSHYNVREEFEMWEIACLLGGMEPADVPPEKRSGIKGEIKFLFEEVQKAYKNARDDLLWFSKSSGCDEEGRTIECWLGGSSLPSIELWEAYEHINYLNSTLETGFRSDAYTDRKINTKNPRFKRGDIKRWLSHLGWSKPGYFSDMREKTEKGLSTRERETLLKLLIGMAMKGFDYNPVASRNEAISEIVASLDGVGLPVSDETIRKYLKEGAALLPDEVKSKLV